MKFSKSQLESRKQDMRNVFRHNMQDSLLRREFLKAIDTATTYTELRLLCEHSLIPYKVKDILEERFEKFETYFEDIFGVPFLADEEQSIPANLCDIPVQDEVRPRALSM